MFEFRRRRVERNDAVLTTDQVRQLVRNNNESLTQNKIITVDFSVIASFADVNWVDMCLVVLSSDGALGTLTHLQVDANVPEFVTSLLNLYDGKPVSICLAGGSLGGEKLIERVCQELELNGFIVSLEPQHASLGGSNMYRQVTIFKDRVRVKHIPYSGPPEIVELIYPKSD